MNELLDLIHDAFSDVPYPGDDDLLSNAEHRTECDECRTLYDVFRGVSWQDTVDDIQWLRHLAHAECFFTVGAWHYFLPALLIQRHRRHRYQASEFAPSGEPLLFEHERQREACLTQEQCAAVVAFMGVAAAHFRGNDDAFFCQQRTLDHWRGVLAAKRLADNRAG